MFKINLDNFPDPILIVLAIGLLLSFLSVVLANDDHEPAQSLLDVGVQICADYNATLIVTSFNYIYCVRDHIVVKKFGCELVDTGRGRSWICEELT